MTRALSLLEWIGWPMTGLGTSLLLLALLVVGEWIAYRLALRTARKHQQQRVEAWKLAQAETQQRIAAARRMEWS